MKELEIKLSVNRLKVSPEQLALFQTITHQAQAMFITINIAHYNLFHDDHEKYVEAFESIENMVVSCAKAIFANETFALEFDVLEVEI